LDLESSESAVGGYDAVGRGTRDGQRIQIKGRAIFDESKSGQRIGQLKVEQEWDSVVLVLMDAEFEPVEIYEAERDVVIEALGAGDDSKRSKRGAMSVAKFKAIARLVWTREQFAAGRGWFVARVLNPAISRLASRNPRLCERTWAYLVGGFSEIVTVMQAVKDQRPVGPSARQRRDASAN